MHFTLWNDTTYITIFFYGSNFERLFVYVSNIMDVQLQDMEMHENSSKKFSEIGYDSIYHCAQLKLKTWLE